jgi:hypothetical protein
MLRFWRISTHILSYILNTNDSLAIGNIKTFIGE